MIVRLKVYGLILLIVVALLPILVSSFQKNRVKQFDSFCRKYPRHRDCMGAFANAGKRTFIENKNREENNDLYGFEESLAQLKKRLRLYGLKRTKLMNHRDSERTNNQFNMIYD